MHDSNRLQRLQQAPLWDFACAFYAAEDVAKACLTLQDSGEVDVCELLFHCWLCRYGLKARTEALIKERVKRNRWQQSVTQTLRGLRRTLKSEALQSDSIHLLRETVKRAELDAEKENLDAWQAFALQTRENVSTFDDTLKSLQDTVIWLHACLFSFSFEQSRQAMSQQSESVESAWVTIAHRLDPINSAR